jgi:hypothetical protein
MDEGFQRLLAVAEMVKEREFEALAGLRREMAVIETEITRLRQPTTSGDPAYSQSGTERRWLEWLQRRIVILNGELALLRAREPDLRMRASRALARAQVLNRVARK